MKRKFTRILAALVLLVFMTPSIAGWGQTRAEGDEITSISNIVSGDTYYIKGVRTNNTYYLTFTDAVGSQSGTESSTISGAIPVTFTLVSGNTYTLRTPNGNYIAPGTSNGKINVSATAINVTATDQNSKIRLSIVSGTTTWSIQKNTSAANFGGYKNTQADITLIKAASSSSPTLSVNPTSINFGQKEINSNNTENITVTYANLSQSLTVVGFEGVSVSPATIEVGEGSGEATVTVTYAPTTVGSISDNITISNTTDNVNATVAVTGSAYDPSNVDTYALYTGPIVEGDYVIYAASGAMKNEIVSNRFANQSVSVSEEVITNPANTVIWHIAADGDYWTIYNAAIQKYAGGTDTKNQGALLDEITTHAQWTITYNNGYSFVNYGRSQDASDPNNKYLRQNNTNGWATYASGTGSAPTLYKKVNTNQVAKPSFNPPAGTYTEAKNVTITCATEGATIQYKTTENGDWQTYSDELTISETTTVWAKATKEGMDDSDEVSATYTINLPLSTIPAIFNAATSAGSNVNVTFGNWVVSGVSGSNVYVTDNNGNGFIVYKSGHGFVVNNKLSGTVYETPLKLYNGSAEFTNLTSSTEGLTVSTDGEITVITNMTIAELGGLNTGAVITLSNLTFDGTNLSDGTSTIKPFNTLYSDMSFTSGKTYNVTGVYQQYDNTKEILPRSEDDIEELAITTPVINASNIEIAYDATGGEIEIEISNPTGATLTATTDSEWLSVGTVSNTAVAFSCSANEGNADRTATVTLSYDGAADKTVTVTQKHFVADYATLPFAFDGGRADIANTAGLTHEGLDSDFASSPKLKFNSTDDYVILRINERPGTLTFDIKGSSFSGGTFKVQTSEDGETYTDLKTYTGLGDPQSESFNNLGENVRYIKWIYTVKSSGNVGLGNIALAKFTHSFTVSPDQVVVDANAHEGGLEYYGNNWEQFGGPEGVQFYNADNETIDQPDWISIDLDVVPGADYDFLYTIAANTGEARSAYFKLWTYDDDGVTVVYSNLVTVNQAAPVVPPTPGNWVLTNLADLTAGDVFVIVGTYNVDGSSYAMANDNGTGNAPTAVEVTIAENTLSGDINENIQWNISGDAKVGYTFYPAGSANTWLYCTNSNNGVRVGTNSNNIFVMEDGYLKNDATSRYVGIYDSQDWRCYTSINNNIAGQTFAFYKKVSDDVTYTKTVAAYEGDGGYVLIASPVCSVAPSADNGFLTGEYDLYAFDQAQEQEWRNYKASNFNLVSGKGYMYASSSATTLTFTGQPYNGNGVISLDYTEGVAFAGWNLVGNPYAVAATPNMPYYRLNAAGSEVSATTESSAVNAMEGVFVNAEQAGSVTFSTATGSKGENIALNLSRANRGGVSTGSTTAIDCAIVRFDEGQQLPKFQLFENSTKLYIPQGNNDFAVVRSAAEGEMPVNFRAAENGTYTINVDVENMEMDYLHLIDNMTGNDVDLLQTPSYTFNAKKSDYASRFKLVFSANVPDGPSTGSGSFAYYNGSEWQISNMGEATLQVVDVMGRIVKSETISGNASISINEAPGVYMMRLVSGNDVKVQKVVVR